MKNSRIKHLCLTVTVLFAILVFASCAANRVNYNDIEIIPPSSTETSDGMILDEKIVLNLYESTIKCGEFFNLTATAFSTRDITISYESSDPTVAKVSNNGRVMGVSEGSAVISVSGGGIVSKCNVTVTKDEAPDITADPTTPPDSTTTPVPTDTPDNDIKPESVVITTNKGKTIYMDLGTSINMEAKVYPEGASQEVYWILSNSRVATLDRYSGLLKATYTPNSNGTGYAQVTAMTADGSVMSEPIDIVVIKRVTQVTINNGDSQLTVGDTMNISYTCAPSKYYKPSDSSGTKFMIFESDNPEVATVSSSGKITALSEGSAVISIIYNHNKQVRDSITVTVKNPEPDVPPTVEPDVPPTVEPDVPPTVEPDIPPTVEPDVPPTVEPDVPPTVEPDVPPEDEPDIPPEDEPDVPLTVEPDVPPTVEPDIPPEDEPDVPPTVEPDIPPTVEPDASSVEGTVDIT